MPAASPVKTPLPPVKFVNVGTVAPVVNAPARLVAPAVPPAPPSAKSAAAS